MVVDQDHQRAIMKVASWPLLILIWLICAAGTLAVGGMVANFAMHPLAPNEAWQQWPQFSLPCFTLALAAWIAAASEGLLAFVLSATIPACWLVSYACYSSTREAMAFLEAEAAGERLMNCGPPFGFILWAVAHLLSTVVLVWCLSQWWQSRSRRVRRSKAVQSSTDRQ
jgi:hypothetical protein